MGRIRNPNRDKAKEDYLNSRGQITINNIADKYNVTNQTIRKWKCIDKWEQCLKEKYPPKRGAQIGNKNAKGYGAPKGNTNALKHGGYSTVFFDSLTDDEQALISSLSNDVRENLKREYQTLIIREHRIKTAIDELDRTTADEVFVDTMTVMETLKTPEERKKEELQAAADQAAEIYIEDADVYVSKKSRKGEKLHLRITNNSSAFARKLKLEEQLIKIQGRIIKVLAEIRACENERLRIGIERHKLSLAHSKLTGEFDIEPDIPEEKTETEENIFLNDDDN